MLSVRLDVHLTASRSRAGCAPTGATTRFGWLGFIDTLRRLQERQPCHEN
jgi:hypothetical protein